MNRYNDDIRNKVQEKGATLCEVAYKVGISETSLFRWLRRPLDEEHKQIILKAIEN